MITRTILCSLIAWTLVAPDGFSQETKASDPPKTDTAKKTDDPGEKPKTEAPPKPDPTKKVIPIAARSDLRVQLLATVFRLADCPEYAVAGEVLLAGNIDEFFKDHKDHPAIKTARSLWQKDRVGFDDIMYLAVNLDTVDSLRRLPHQNRATARFERKWPKARTDEFLKHLRDWVAKSEFRKKLAQSRDARGKSTENLKKKIAKQTYVAWFRHFFGIEDSVDYHAVPGLLNGPYTYVVPSARDNGKTDLFIIPGVLFADRKGVAMFEEDFDRSVVDALCLYGAKSAITRHIEKIAPNGQILFDQIKDKMHALGIYNGKAMVEESIARAASVRYVENVAGKMAGQSEMYRHQGLGFFWIDELALLLRDYESDRRTYPNLDAFAPKIDKLFADWSKMHIADADSIAKGPILRMFSRPQDHDDLLMVSPDVFPDAGTRRGVTDYVAGVWEALFKNQFVSRPTPAGEITKDQRRTSAMILFGSPSSNVVLRDVMKKCDMSITRTELKIGDKTYTGQNIILITIFPNPYNKEKPVLIYAAHDDNYIINLNTFLHGPTDYLIGRWGPRDEPIIIREGDYTKRPDGTWSIK